MYNKFKLIKWSHIHDYIIIITMIIVFGTFAQMHDYHTGNILQILGIILSYIFAIIIVVYYSYMANKLHRMVKLSNEDPRSFS